MQLEHSPCSLYMYSCKRIKRICLKTLFAFIFSPSCRFGILKVVFKRINFGQPQITGKCFDQASYKLILPCPSSLKTNSLFSFSFSFFPLLLFLPPFPIKKIVLFFLIQIILLSLNIMAVTNNLYLSLFISYSVSQQKYRESKIKICSWKFQ